MATWSLQELLLLLFFPSPTEQKLPGDRGLMTYSVCWLWTRTAKHFCFCLTLDSVYMYPPTYCLSRVSPFGWKLSTGILIITVILISSCCRNPSLFWMWLIFVCLHGHFNQFIYINLYLRCCAPSMILASDDFQALANTTAMAGGVMLSVCLSVYPTLIMEWIKLGNFFSVPLESAWDFAGQVVIFMNKHCYTVWSVEVLISGFSRCGLQTSGSSQQVFAY